MVLALAFSEKSSMNRGSRKPLSIVLLEGFPGVGSMSAGLYYLFFHDIELPLNEFLANDRQ